LRILQGNRCLAGDSLGQAYLFVGELTLLGEVNLYQPNDGISHHQRQHKHTPPAQLVEQCHLGPVGLWVRSRHNHWLSATQHSGGGWEVSNEVRWLLNRLWPLGILG